MKPWWLRLSTYAVPHWRGLSATGSLMVLGVLAEVAKPWPLKILVDYVFMQQPLPEYLSGLKGLPGGESSLGLVAWLAGGTVLLFVITQGVTIVQTYLKSGLGSRMVYDLAGDLFDHMQRLSLRFHGRQPAGDLVRRIMASTGCVRDLIMSVSIPLLTSTLTLLIMLVVMIQLDWKLALISASVAIPIFALIKLFSRPMTERSFAQQQLEGELMTHAERALSSVQIVQAYTREAQEEAGFRRLGAKTLSAQFRTLATQLQFKIGVGSLTAVGMAVIMAIGGFQVLEGVLTVGTLLVFLSYLQSFYTPLEQLAYLSTGYTSAAAGAMRVFEVFDTQDRVPEHPKPVTLDPNSREPRGHIVFENVTFGYVAGQPVLKNVNLEVKPGEHIALVGPTGSGKSTMVSLMLRFYDPWEGRILLDGVDIRDLSLKELRSQFAMVLQDPFLLPLSIAENIAYGRPGASRKEIEQAAEAAQAMEFIEKLPDGLDTVIGERGAALSGGQKQRISIARAALSGSAVLILDEATSALDLEVEKPIVEALSFLNTNRTTVSISHRQPRSLFFDRATKFDLARHCAGHGGSKILTKE